MKLKRDTKFGKESTRFKIGIINLTNFDVSTRKSQRFSLYGLLMSKLYVVLAKKVQRSNLWWNWRGMQNLRGIDSSFQNSNKEFDKIWPEHAKISKTFILMGSFWAKYIFFELKKYKGIIFHETEEGYKIWKGIDSLFQNWHDEFDNIWPKHSKISKIFILMVSFWAKYIFFELTKYRGIIFHETEERYKIWRGSDLSFQYSHKEFNKIWPEHSKISKIFILMGSFSAKYILFELKKYRGVIFHETEEGYKIWKGIDLSFQIWHKEFDLFWPEHSKV